MFGFLKKRRRMRLVSKPFPFHYRTILVRNFPLYSRLPADDQKELHGHIQIFLSEKQFEGCDGLRITQEIKVTVAAQACLLLLHRETDYYPRVSTILIYPTAYVAPVKKYSDPWLLTEGKEVRSGEAWQRGAVVLSWEDVCRNAENGEEGSNVVLHEFAHQLDMEDNAADGIPVLPNRSMYETWTQVMNAEYEQLKSDSEYNRSTVMDEYGASSPAEFFAVATECFFEIPVKLKIFHPRLYEQLKEFYQQDPVKFYAEH